MKTVIILTIPRSCSSLLGGILTRLGVWMGPWRDMQMGRHLNKLGCYENQDFLHLELNFLYSVDMLLNYINRVRIDEQKIATLAQSYRSKYQEAIKRNQKELWGFKDGALIYIIPYIYDLFPNPYFIHLERNHSSTATSIRKSFGFRVWYQELREKFPHFSFKRQFQIVKSSIKMFITHNKRMYSDKLYRKMVDVGHRRINDFLQDKHHLHIKTDEMLHHPDKVISDIKQFLGLSFTQKQKRMVYDFVQPELINHKS